MARHDYEDELRQYIKGQRLQLVRIEKMLDRLDELEWENESLKQRMEIIMEARNGSSAVDE